MENNHCFLKWTKAKKNYKINEIETLQNIARGETTNKNESKYIFDWSLILYFWVIDDLFFFHWNSLMLFCFDWK